MNHIAILRKANIKKGDIDAFRLFCKEPGYYTWWANSKNNKYRKENVVWRLDYFIVSCELSKKYT